MATAAACDRSHAGCKDERTNGHTNGFADHVGYVFLDNDEDSNTASVSFRGNLLGSLDKPAISQNRFLRPCPQAQVP